MLFLSLLLLIYMMYNEAESAKAQVVQTRQNSSSGGNAEPYKRDENEDKDRGEEGKTPAITACPAGR